MPHWGGQYAARSFESNIIMAVRENHEDTLVRLRFATEAHKTQVTSTGQSFSGVLRLSGGRTKATTTRGFHKDLIRRLHFTFFGFQKLFSVY